MIPGIIAAQLLGASTTPIESMFVAVGSDDGQSTPIIMASEDGLTWSQRTSIDAAAANAVLQSVASNGSRWVSVGYLSDPFGDPCILTSDDSGNTWVSQTPDPTTDAMLTSVCWTGTKFIAVGHDSGVDNPIVMNSTDGETWTARTSAGTTNILWHGVSGISGLAIAVGSDGTAENTPKIMTSADDGDTWTARTPATGTALRDVVCVTGKHIAAGFSGSTTSRIMSSAAGTTWANETGPSDYLFYGIAHNGSLYVAVGSDFNSNMVPRIASSSNGSAWTGRTPDPTSDANGIELQSVAAGPTGDFVAVGRDFNNFDTPFIMYSADGLTWSAQTPQPSANCILLGVGAQI